MPFTPAHAAAALPFFRVRGLRRSALVLGTMLPDLPHFVGFAPEYDVTHSWGWAIPSTLPYGIALWFLYEWCKAPLVELLPSYARSRLVSHTAVNRPQGLAAWSMFCVSLAIGVATHLVWDAFTHSRGAGLAVIPALSEVWMHSPIGVLRGFRVLQFASSIFGLIVVAAYAWRIMRKQPVTHVPKGLTKPARLIATCVIVLVIPAACALHANAAAAGSGDDFFRQFTFVFLTSTIEVEAAALLTFTLLVKLRKLT